MVETLCRDLNVFQSVSLNITSPCSCEGPTGADDVWHRYADKGRRINRNECRSGRETGIEWLWEGNGGDKTRKTDRNFSFWSCFLFVLIFTLVFPYFLQFYSHLWLVWLKITYLTQVNVWWITHLKTLKPPKILLSSANVEDSVNHINTRVEFWTANLWILRP